MDDAELAELIELADEFRNPTAALREILRLRTRIEELQEDLDQAVGYRLAVREQTSGETKGDQDRDV